jgi:TetR/AcrR family transcriptional repressor of uid operon
MPRLSADQQAARRTRLLDAAERCVARSGFHAATMAEIARAARVSAGAAYIYFRSKEDLIAGIAERDRERLAADFAAIAEAPDFADALEACARAHLIDRPAHKRRLWLELGAEASRNPAVARSHRGVDQVVQAAFRAALERQIAAGRIAPAIGLDALVNVLRLLGDGLFHRRAVEPDADPEALLAAAMDLVRRILVPAQASVTPRRRRRRP